MAEIKIIRHGNLLGITDKDNNKIPPLVANLLESELSYTYVKQLFGIQRKDPITGCDRPVQIENRKQYVYDQSGRFCCGFGFLKKITKLLTDAGYTVNVKTVPSEGVKNNRYKVNYDIIANAKFRPKQEEAVMAVITNECGVIEAPPAFGKSHIIMYLCKVFPKARIDIVTKRKDIVDKTVTYLTKYLPSVGQVGGGKKKIERVTVFTADSLHLSDGKADILIADEVHELMADSYAAELARYRHSRNYGLTATPKGRKDGTDARLESFFGPTIFKIDYKEAVGLNLVAQIHVDWINVEHISDPGKGKSGVVKKRWSIWRNTDRNEIIAQAALKYEDKQVLILVDTIEHALYLRKLLPSFELCYSENGIDANDLEMYRRQGLIGKTEEPIDAKKREFLRKSFEKGEIQKVIATGVWSTGVDFVNLQVLIRADAASSEIMDFQAPGRVCRIADGKEHGIVVDFYDKFDAWLERRAKTRYRNYKNKGWQQQLPK